MKYTAKDINKVKGSTIVFFFITCIVLVVALLFVFHILSFDIINNLAGREAFKAGSEPVFLLIGGLVFGIGALVFFPELFGKNRMKKKIDAVGEDKILDQINNHLILAPKKSSGKGIACFITEEYVVSPCWDIVNTKDVIWTYVHNQNNTPYYTMMLKNGKEFRPGVIAYKNADKECDEAVRKVNPNLLAGYSKENAAAYKAMVKVHKG